MTNHVSLMNRRRVLAGGAALGIATVLPWRADASEVRRGGVLKYATLGLDTADPHRHTGSIAVQQLYVEALTSIGPDGNVEPFLAESFDLSEDGKIYTFRLREGVKFHNDEVLTASDVVANIERVKSKVSGGWLASAMKLVDAINAPDARTVVLALKEPYSPLLNLMSELWILSPKSEGWADTIRTPIGTGPFRFGEWQPRVKLVAPAHKAYWREGMPYLEAVEADLRDDVDMALALRAGDLHVAKVSREVAAQLGRSTDIAVTSLKDSSWFFVSFNNRSPRPPFNDLRVRQAIAYAVDKTAFMRFAAGGTGVVTNQMIAPGNIYFDKAQHDADPHAKPDLEKAKRLLADAGVKPAETRLELVSWQENYPQVVVQMIRRLGFQVNHVALDDLGAQKRLGQYDWDLAVMSSGPRADVFLRYVRLMSDGPNPVLWGGVQDPEFDKLVRAAVAEPDLPDRKALYTKAWQRVLDNYYTVVLGHASDTIALRRQVKGYEPGFTWSPNWASGGIAQTWLSA
ncbi:ABC transporter substrate-binding protein [Bradyrhizobium sp. LHD-71]|uniref:ABC transporter substrate-binding protein n=1 Tax=Bradyrhizobium sp. LHD-71 TaxID=3072141 RepID=UPI00280D7185|nr:ABC transporter substrate-binding protein [Bradyrhizobium sp. LHD-71]MDQ8732344.1 ABC transporter substrate-binding protein [Bradyrhizobium sp. LHD-71]